MTSNGPGHSISYNTTCPLSDDSDQLASAQADLSHCFALISQTSNLSHRHLKHGQCFSLTDYVSGAIK